MATPVSQLSNLSRRASEMQTQHILRVNAENDLGNFAFNAKDRANKGTKGTSKFVRRTRAANEAMPPTKRWEDGSHYRTGDGEFQLTRRPGSADHLKYKSLNVGDYPPINQDPK